MTTLPESSDPAVVLGVAPGADAETRHQAYLARVREFPPDRSPAEFERIRDAYLRLGDPLAEAEAQLGAEDPGAPLSDLLAGRSAGLAYLGPEPWLRVLREGEA
jgi:curved DNA-binding protein CbpA